MKLLPSIFISLSIALISSFKTIAKKQITSTCYNNHFVGEKFGGGIVFYVSADGQHGLIVATSDQSTNVPWSNGKFIATGTTGEKINGSKNTNAIISLLADTINNKFAAKFCADYSITTDGNKYEDWYLPSKYELNLLFIKKDSVGVFDNYYYWTSSEVNGNEAWIQNFYDGMQLNVSKTDGVAVRAIRSF